MPPYLPHLTNTTAAPTQLLVTQGHIQTPADALLGDIDCHWLS